MYKKSKNKTVAQQLIKFIEMSHLSADIQYLMHDKIGKVLAEGFAALYRAKPNQPIDYFSKWLLNNCSTVVNQEKADHDEQVKEELIQKFNHLLEQNQKEAERVQKIKEEEDKVESEFREKIEKHQYHHELLPSEFPNFIQKQRKFPGVYIGVLDHPSRPVTDDDEDEMAHLDVTQEKRIIYIGAADNSQQMIGKFLEPGKGVTYDAFLPVAVQNEEGIDENIIEDYKYYSDVTQNNRIFFFRIPKLGAYLSVPLSYRSVLHEISLDEGIKERKRVRALREEQTKAFEEEELDYRAKVEEMQKNEDDEGLATLQAEWEEKQANFKLEEEKEFEDIQKDYVVCVDTLGEDREITVEERKYCVDLVKHFIKSWEESEKQQLNRDIDAQIIIYEEVNREEFLNVFNTRLEEDVKERQLAHNANIDPSQPEDENTQNFWRSYFTFEFYKKSLIEEEFKNKIKALIDFRVVKYRGIIQDAFYLIGYTKEQINNPGQNVMNWKETRHLLTDAHYFNKLADYDPLGPKETEVKRYAYVNRMIKRLEKYNMEEVDEYNLGLGILLKFLKQGLETRIQDITRRREDKAQAKQRREQAINDEEARKAQREAELQAARDSYVDDGENGPFNEEDWLAKWEEEHPAILIPDEVIDDIDADIEPPEQPAFQRINLYG